MGRVPSSVTHAFRCSRCRPRILPPPLDRLCGPTCCRACLPETSVAHPRCSQQRNGPDLRFISTLRLLVAHALLHLLPPTCHALPCVAMRRLLPNHPSIPSHLSTSTRLLVHRHPPRPIHPQHLLFSGRCRAFLPSEEGRPFHCSFSGRPGSDNQLRPLLIGPDLDLSRSKHLMMSSILFVADISHFSPNPARVLRMSLGRI